jgi:ADP-heptose:LPS heptosyltransferase
LFTWFDRLFGRAIPSDPPQRILIILLSEMGSLVLAEAMFSRLKQKYPNASLHMLMFRKNREVLDLMNVMPPENILTLNDKSLGEFVRDCLAALWALRRLKPDVVIDCELFSRVSSIFSFLSGAPRRVGFHPHTQEGLYRGDFINRPVMYNPYRHLSQQLLGLAAAIDAKAYPLTKAEPLPMPSSPPMLQFHPGEKEQAAARLEADFPAIVGKRLVLVYPSGGALPIRAWPQTNYTQLIAALLADGHAVGLTGLPEDHALAAELVRQSGSALCINLAGYTTSVRHLLALFHRADLLITNDGGPGQFAALTPIPSIVFFGPETPLLYGSLSPNAYCFHRSLPCSPCLTAYNHRLSPCDGDNQCLKQIAPAEVIAKARAMLAA